MTEQGCPRSGSFPQGSKDAGRPEAGRPRQPARMSAAMKLRLSARSFLIQSLWSFENMQGLGLGWCLEPWLQERWGASPAEARRALARHCDHFNTNPYMSGLAIGMVCALEGRISAAPVQERPGLEEKLRSLKTSSAGALAAIGDSFFWGAWRPFCTVLALAAGMTAVLSGDEPRTVALAAAGAYVVVYNIPALFLRLRGVDMGFRWGERFAQELATLGWRGPLRAARLAGTVLAAGCAGICLFSMMAASPGRAAALAAACGAGWAARAYGLASRKLYAAAWVLGTLAAGAGLRW